MLQIRGSQVSSLPASHSRSGIPRISGENRASDAAKQVLSISRNRMRGRHPGVNR